MRPPRQIGWVITLEDWALIRRLVADGVPLRHESGALSEELDCPIICRVGRPLNDRVAGAFPGWPNRGTRECLLPGVRALPCLASEPGIVLR